MSLHKTLAIAVLGLHALCAQAAPPHAPPKPPRPTPPVVPPPPVNPTLNSVCLWEKPNFQGAALCSQSGANVPSLAAWGHGIQSVSVAPGLVATLYSAANYSGYAVTVTESVADLQALNFSGSTASYQVYGATR